MLDLNTLDVDEIATALSEWTDYEHTWVIDPRTGEIAFRTSDTGIDGENPIDPMSWTWSPSTHSHRSSGTRTWVTSPSRLATPLHDSG